VFGDQVPAFQKKAGGLVARGKAERGDVFAAEEMGQAVVAPAAEHGAIVFRVVVKDLKDHAIVVVKAANQAGLEANPVAEPGRLQSLEDATGFQIAGLLFEPGEILQQRFGRL
jgi:ribosomal protein S11